MARQYTRKRGARIYALYKGDNFLDLGTKEYLANLLGVKEETIKFYGTPSYLKRGKNDYPNRYVTTFIGYETDKIGIKGE